MQKLAGDHGRRCHLLPVRTADRVPAGQGARPPPKTAEELLAYAKANPSAVQYARPANSGPGRTFLMGLPYLLGDNDPKDPVNGWDKTWAYLSGAQQVRRRSTRPAPARR